MLLEDETSFQTVSVRVGVMMMRQRFFRHCPGRQWHFLRLPCRFYGRIGVCLDKGEANANKRSRVGH